MALVDLLRGLAIALVVLEAARQYFDATAYQFNPLDPEHTTPLIYATRWLTHFFAPILALLLGAAVHLRLEAGAGRVETTRYLITRGLLLVLLEVTVVTFGRNFTLFPPILFQALGTAGCALMALGLLIWLPRNAVLVLGAAILLGHNLLEGVDARALGPLANIWRLLHEAVFVVRDERLFFLADYAILPWVGLAMFGYGLGPVFLAAPARRDRIFFALGVVMIALFLVLRVGNLYGDPAPWGPQDDVTRSALSFLNVSKFPPSLLFMCATLGPVFMLAPLIARLRGPAAEILTTFGQAPLFAFVLHFYLAHTLSLMAMAAAGHDPSLSIDAIGKFVLTPQALEGTGFSPPIVYLVWFALLAVLYPLCRWWLSVKRTRAGWFGYL